MICLLCYEPNADFISIDGEYGKQLNISTLLYKYFKFCFDVSSFGSNVNSHLETG